MLSSTTAIAGSVPYDVRRESYNTRRAMCTITACDAHHTNASLATGNTRCARCNVRLADLRRATYTTVPCDLRHAGIRRTARSIQQHATLPRCALQRATPNNAIQCRACCPPTMHTWDGAASIAPRLVLTCAGRNKHRRALAARCGVAHAVGCALWRTGQHTSVQVKTTQILAPLRGPLEYPFGTPGPFSPLEYPYP